VTEHQGILSVTVISVIGESGGHTNGLDEFSQTRISHQVAYALAEFGFRDRNISWATDIFIDNLCIEIEKEKLI
jgi:hypothetical protein